MFLIDPRQQGGNISYFSLDFDNSKSRLTKHDALERKQVERPHSCFLIAFDNSKVQLKKGRCKKTFSKKQTTSTN